MPDNYGESNTFITKDAAEYIRARIKVKLHNLNSGFDPKLLTTGAHLAVFHIETGARKFADFTTALVDDFGEDAKPQYSGARDFPGFDSEGMNCAVEFDDCITNEAKTDGSTEREGTDTEQGGTARTDSGSGEQQPGPDANADTQAGGTPKSDRPVGERETGDDAQVQTRGDTDATGDVSDNADGAPSDAGHETGRSDDSGTGAPTDVLEESMLSNSVDTGLTTIDFVLDDMKQIFGGTPRERFEKNRQALELANESNLEDRQANVDEQKSLTA